MSKRERPHSLLLKHSFLISIRRRASSGGERENERVHEQAEMVTRDKDRKTGTTREGFQRKH